MTSADRRQLTEKLFESFHAIKLRIASDFAGTPSAITLSQSLVLGFVEKRKGAGIGAIAEHLGITSSAATQLVNGLVAKGYLVRRKNPEDRRELAVALSATGRKKTAAMKKERLRKMKLLFKALDEGEIREYYRLNKKIAESIGSKNNKK